MSSRLNPTSNFMDCTATSIGISIGIGIGIGISISKCILYSREYYERQKALSMVRQNGWNLRNLDAKFRDDEEIVAIATQNSEFSFRFVSQRLRANKEIIFMALTFGGNYLNFQLISEKNLLLDRDFILKCVQCNGLVLDLLPIHFKKDKEIIEEARKQNPISYLRALFDNDDNPIQKQHLVKAIKCYEETNCRFYSYSSPLEFVPNKMVGLLDKKELEWAMEKSGSTLLYIPEDCVNKKLVEIAISKNPESIIYLPKKYLKDDKFIHELIDINHEVLYQMDLSGKCILKDFLNDEIFKKVLKKDATILHYYEPKFLDDNEILYYILPTTKTNFHIELDFLKYRHNESVINDIQTMRDKGKIVRTKQILKFVHCITQQNIDLDFRTLEVINGILPELPRLEIVKKD